MQKKKNNKSDDKSNNKIYDKIIPDNFLFEFEKDKMGMLKNYDIKYYIINNKKITEFKQK